MRLASLVAVGALSLACEATPGKGQQTAGGTKGAAPGSETGGEASTDGDAKDPNAPFENPGGMWMPGQMAEHSATLQKLGVEFDPKDLTDPTAFPLGAVVSLGGCSASFVSSDGLIVTNHHCVGRALQYNSTPEKNRLEEGFLAETLKDEVWAGPTSRVYVTTAFTDVTDAVLGGTADITDDEARSKKIDGNRKALVGKCEEGKPATRCRVASYFEATKFFQIEQIEIKDVRLVYAPHAGVGVFGGEVDNWRWPRHTGDYSFLRAYVGPDQKPADHDAKNNVPYKPAHHLELASEPLQPGDFVMVAGYPGRTTRFKTADEVALATKWGYPRGIARREQYIAVLEEVTKDDPELEIKASATLRGLNNGLTNSRGMLDGLAKGGLAEQRAKEQEELQAWIDSDPARAEKWGTVLADIAKLNAKHDANRDSDAAMSEIMRASAPLRTAFMLLEMAENRDKPDAERDARFQERNWPRQEQGITQGARNYDRKIDRAVFALMLRRAAELDENKRPLALGKIVGDDSSDAGIEAALDGLYAKTELEDPKVVLAMFKKAKRADLEESEDPFIVLARQLEGLVDELETRSDAHEGAMAALRPNYVAALKEWKGGMMAPDANSTLRITFGTVRGYAPEPGKPVYDPFTKVSEMVAKHTGEEPFDAPESVLAAVKDERFGPYVDEKLGEVPVDFLADLDITGGNSGSATLNRKGELVGLAFDGNYEAMASDWIFMPDITRSIHVDLRYILWVMDAVDGADRLMEEMGAKPAIEAVGSAEVDAEEVATGESAEAEKAKPDAKKKAG